MYTNADQLPNKLEELKTRLDIEKPQIIAVVEVNTKTNTKPELKIFTIPGYTIYSKNVSQIGRGIITYIHESIQRVTEVKTETQFEEQYLLQHRIGYFSDAYTEVIV